MLWLSQVEKVSHMGPETKNRFDETSATRANTRVGSRSRRSAAQTKTEVTLTRGGASQVGGRKRVEPHRLGGSTGVKTQAARS